MATSRDHDTSRWSRIEALSGSSRGTAEGRTREVSHGSARAAGAVFATQKATRNYRLLTDRHPYLNTFVRSES